jgi:hypothetical protein
MENPLTIKFKTLNDLIKDDMYCSNETKNKSTAIINEVIRQINKNIIVEDQIISKFRYLNETLENDGDCTDDTKVNVNKIINEITKSINCDMKKKPAENKTDNDSITNLDRLNGNYLKKNIKTFNHGGKECYFDQDLFNKQMGCAQQ